jgi:hypothetical protein
VFTKKRGEYSKRGGNDEKRGGKSLVEYIGGLHVFVYPAIVFPVELPKTMLVPALNPDFFLENVSAGGREFLQALDLFHEPSAFDDRPGSNGNDAPFGIPSGRETKRAIVGLFDLIPGPR